jgi:multiple sugar transport system permease protein
MASKRGNGKMNKRTKRIELYIIYFVLGLACLVVLIPIVHAFLISIKEPIDAFSFPPKLLFKPTLRHHIYVWTEAGFPRYLFNSLIIAIGTVAIAVPVASLGGFAFARIRTSTTRSMLFVILALRMFPRVLLVITYFLVARLLKLYDTHIIMILVMAAFNLPFSLWLMRGFFLDIPQELEEAAMIDGCSTLRAFFSVILPVVKPGLVATTLFGFLLAYNEYLFPLILTGTRAKTLPVAIGEYGAENIEYWSISAAGAIGIIIPVVVIMLFLQKHLVRGLTFGAVKG